MDTNSDAQEPSPAKGSGNAAAGNNRKSMPWLTIFAWVWVFICFTAAMGVILEGGILAPLFMVAMGLLALPPLWRQLAMHGYGIPAWPRVGITFFLMVIFPSSPSANSIDEETAEVEAEATEEPEQRVDPVAEKLALLQEKIVQNAVIEMDRNDYAKTYAKLGEAQFDNANNLMRWAAIAAAESKQCDQVEIVDVSDRATRSELQWFVDCKNKERFQIKQAQAEAAKGKYDPDATPQQRKAAKQVAVAEPKSARWKNFNEAIAVTACQSLVRSAMINQGSFDTAWGWDSEKNDDTGIVTIQQDFEAENGFGGTISSRYHCEVDTNLAGRITTLKIREINGWRDLI
ncbi:MAG: hypothetical protein R3E02_12015 [Blastomonas sp.]